MGVQVYSMSGGLVQSTRGSFLQQIRFDSGFNRQRIRFDSREDGAGVS
jgi:hypothetical protein